MGERLRGWITLAWVVSIAAGHGADVVPVPDQYFGLGDVRLIAASADQRYLASGGQGGAFLWDLTAAALTKHLDVGWSATALAFSPDHRLLVVASHGNLVAWDLATREPVREFTGHGGEIHRILFSPDGRQLLSASSDNSVRIWSVETGSELRSLRTPGSPITEAAISPDGRLLATVDSFLTNSVKIWDVETGTQLRALPTTNWPAQRCLFLPQDGLVITGADRSVLLWDPETAGLIRSFPGITGATTLVITLWAPDEDTLAAACTDGAVYLWNIRTAELLHVVPGEPVVATCGIPGQFLTIAASLDCALRVRQLPGGDTLQTLRGHTTSVHSGVAYSPDGRFVLSGGTEGATRLWDRRTGKPVREFVGSPGGTLAAAFSPDGSRVLTTIGLPSPGARLWRTETGELEREILWAGSWPMGAVFSPDGTMIATRSQGGEILLFNADTGARLRTLPSGAFGGPMAFAPKASLLAAASTEFGADLFDLESGRRLHTLPSGNAGPVTALAFAPDGATLMVAWNEGLVHFHDTITFQRRGELIPAAAFLESAMYSPDGRHLLTGEGWPLFTATLWDLASRRRVRTFAGHQWGVSALAFSADGTRILTGADRVREWSIADITARLELERFPDQVRLSWPLGELQHASDPGGPWRPVPDATSPATLPLTGAAVFFRAWVDSPE
ncbi:MAG: WD40 repeat domain-containing protein [Verrucomicrobiae bacterium]|nr:WD40 repeat domain-containing protein [Verrucomicrobiae bacterium]